MLNIPKAANRTNMITERTSPESDQISPSKR